MALNRKKFTMMEDANLQDVLKDPDFNDKYSLGRLEELLASHMSRFPNRTAKQLAVHAYV